ncbi:MAG: hypothetical protein U0Q16_12615 [Bryobacteraceae bacterium]
MGPFLGFLAGFLIFARLAAGASLAEAAADMGRRITVRLRPQETIRLQVRVIGAADDPAPVEAVLIQSLRPRIRAGEQASQVRVTLSRAADANLLVGEINRPEGSTVMIVAYEAGKPETQRYELTLAKHAVWRQAARILDIATVEGGLLVLDENRLALVRDNFGATTEQAAAPVPHEAPWPRDLRGRLVVREEGFDAYLPGVSCKGMLRPEFRLECVPQERPWPLGSVGDANPVPGRNHFVHARLGPVFSAVMIGDTAAVASAEGKVWTVKPPAGATAVQGVGSELSVFPDPCGGGSLVLASNIDGSAVGLYRASGQGLAAVSQPMEVEGTLTALWNDTAIVRTGVNGGYAAYRISAACRR